MDLISRAARTHLFATLAALVLSFVYPLTVVATEVSLMSQGASLMSLADTLAAQSRASLQRSNELRKAIGAARFRLSKFPEGEHRQFMLQQIDLQAKHLQSWKEQGAKLRDQSEQLVQESLALFKKGMTHQWQPWVSNAAPLPSSSKTQSLSFAHNTLVRSVHPRMPAPGVGSEVRPSEGMSLQVSAISGQELPPGLNLESFSISRDRKLFAHIEVEPITDNTPANIPLNKLHQWRLIVSTADGKPLPGLTINFAGHMPGHVHGLPTQPKIDQELAPGVYKVSGVKFQMRGWWVIDFTVNTGEFTDHVRFNIVL
jgi:YtkA-like